MSEDHKQALAKGRVQGRAVRDYLAALEQDRRPGRKVDRPTLERRIADAQARIEAEPDPAKRVDLIQRRLDDQERLDRYREEPDTAELEKAFIDAVKEYSERKGITYTAWREAGVPASVLKAAGVPRTRRTS